MCVCVCNRWRSNITQNSVLMTKYGRGFFTIVFKSDLDT